MSWVDDLQSRFSDKLSDTPMKIITNQERKAGLAAALKPQRKPEYKVPRQHRPQMRVLEKFVMQDIEATLREYRGWRMRTEAGGVIRHVGDNNSILQGSRNVGAPDWIWLHREYGFWGIEAKAWNGMLSQAQYNHLEDIISHGGTGVIICSVGGLRRAIREWRLLCHLDAPEDYPFPIF